MPFTPSGKKYEYSSLTPRPTDATENSIMYEIDTEDNYRYNRYGRWEFIPPVSHKSKRLHTLYIPISTAGFEIFGEPNSQNINAELHSSGCMIYQARTSLTEFETANSEGFIGINDLANVTLLPKAQMVFSFNDTGSNSSAFIGLKDDSTPFMDFTDVTANPHNDVAAIGFGYRSGDTNYQVFHNDSTGAATIVDTGIARDTNVYMLEIEYSTSTDVRLTLFDIDMEVVYDQDYTTEIPGTGIDLGFIAQVQNANTAARYVINMFDFVRLEKNKAPLDPVTDF